MSKYQQYTTFERAPFYEVARPYITPTAKVLDIGPGDGSFSKHFNRNDFYLLEGNEETVNFLKKSYKNITLGSVPKLPYENNFFDLIHCSHVIEHLQPQEFYDTLKEMDRCLNINGHLVISAPLLWDEFYDDLSHVKPYTPKVIQKYLVWGDSSCATRKLISDKYTLEKIIYRTYWQRISEDLYIGNQQFISKVIRKILNIFNVRKLKKNGFTIILKKN